MQIGTAQLITMELPLSLLVEWDDAQDKLLVVHNWLERFDNCPTMTDEPDVLDRWVGIIESRLEAALSVLRN